MALNKEISLQFLDGEAPFCMKVSKVGCHKKVLLVPSPVGTYQIMWIGETHGRSLNRG